MAELKLNYCTFSGKENKIFSSKILEESGGIDALGFRGLNLRFSDILFPECSTLMPNLVYFYYLFAICDVVDKKIDEGKLPLNKREEKIEQYEKNISGYLSQNSSKGFKGAEAKSRPYDEYKNSMRKLKFIEVDEGEKIFDRLNEKLTKTKRYAMVENVITKDLEKENSRDEGKTDDEKGQIIDEKEFKDGFDKYHLEPEEKADFCQRLVLADVWEKKYSPSLFAYMVLYYYAGPKVESKDLPLFEEIPSFEEKNPLIVGLKTIADELDAKKIFIKGWKEILEEEYIGENGESERYEKAKKIYNIAVQYSALQYIIKTAYNGMIFRYHKKNKETYYEKLKEKIKIYRESYQETSYITKKYIKNVPVNINNEDDILWEFLRRIHNKITEKRDDEGCTEYAKCTKCAECAECAKCAEYLLDFEREENEIKKRELEVLDVKSILNSDAFAVSPVADYVDTFRWEYRPSGNADKGKEEIERKKMHTMCVRYYMNELFGTEK